MKKQNRYVISRNNSEDIEESELHQSNIVYHEQIESISPNILMINNSMEAKDSIDSQKLKNDSRKFQEKNKMDENSPLVIWKENESIRQNVNDTVRKENAIQSSKVKRLLSLNQLLEKKVIINRLFFQNMLIKLFGKNL